MTPNFRIFAFVLLACALLTTCVAHSAEPTEQESRARLGYFIIGASMARQLQTVRELSDAGVPGKTAAKLVAERCTFNNADLITIVLDREPVPQSISQVLVQSVIVTEQLCPFLTDGKRS